MDYKTAVLCVIASLLVLDVVVVLGCTKWPAHIRSPQHAETDEQKVYYSEYVVFGTVGKTINEPNPFDDLDGVETVLFDVACIYKANKMDSPVPTVIKVIAVGNMNNQLPGCPPAPLNEGQSAILFLRKLKGQGLPEGLFEIQFKPIADDNIPDDYLLDDLSMLCGLTLTFPIYFTERVDDRCYAPLSEDDCVPYIPQTAKPDMFTVTSPPVTSPPVTEAPRTPPKEEPEPESESGEDRESGKSNDMSGGHSVQTLSKSLTVLACVLYVIIHILQ